VEVVRRPAARLFCLGSLFILARAGGGVHGACLRFIRRATRVGSSFTNLASGKRSSCGSRAERSVSCGRLNPFAWSLTGTPLVIHKSMMTDRNGVPIQVLRIGFSPWFTLEAVWCASCFPAGSVMAFAPRGGHAFVEELSSPVGPAM